MKIHHLALDEINLLGNEAYKNHQEIMKVYPPKEDSDKARLALRLEDSLKKQCEWVNALKEIID